MAGKKEETEIIHAVYDLGVRLSGEVEMHYNEIERPVDLKAASFTEAHQNARRRTAAQREGAGGEKKAVYSI